MQDKLVKTTLWSYAAKLAATVLFFLADIMIARILNLKLYAEWAFFYSVLSMVYYIFWFGVNSSSKVFVSKTTPGQEECRQCIRAGLGVRAKVSLALTLVSTAVILLLPQFAFYRDLNERYPHFCTLIWLIPLIAGLNSFAEFFKETEIGVRDYRGAFIITALEYGAILAAGAAGTAVFQSPTGTGIGFLAAYAVTFLAGILLIRKWNGVRLLQKSTREIRETAGKIFRYALPLAMIGIGGIILVEMDTFMLGILSTPEDVSNYAIAKQICTKASHINNALAIGTLSAFSVIKAGEYPQKRKAFARVARINFLVTLGTGILMLLLAGFAIGLLYGEQYAAAAPIVRCLVPYYILYGFSAFYAMFLDYHGKAGHRSFWYAAMVTINLVLNYLLIPPYRTTGACIATAVSLVPYTSYLLYESYLVVWKERKKEYEG